MSCVFGIVIDNSSNVDLEDKATGILSSVEEVKTLMVTVAVSDVYKGI